MNELEIYKMREQKYIAKINALIKENVSLIQLLEQSEKNLVDTIKKSKEENEKIYRMFDEIMSRKENQGSHNGNPQGSNNKSFSGSNQKEDYLTRNSTNTDRSFTTFENAATASTNGFLGTGTYNKGGNASATSSNGGGNGTLRLNKGSQTSFEEDEGMGGGQMGQELCARVAVMLDFVQRKVSDVENCSKSVLSEMNMNRNETNIVKKREVSLKLESDDTRKRYEEILQKYMVLERSSRDVANERDCFKTFISAMSGVGSSSVAHHARSQSIPSANNSNVSNGGGVNHNNGDGEDEDAWSSEPVPAFLRALGTVIQVSTGGSNPSIPSFANLSASLASGMMPGGSMDSTTRGHNKMLSETRNVSQGNLLGGLNGLR